MIKRMRFTGKCKWNSIKEISPTFVSMSSGSSLTGGFFQLWSLQWQWCWCSGSGADAVAMVLMQHRRRATDTDSGLSELILQTPTFRLSTVRLSTFSLDTIIHVGRKQKTTVAPMSDSLCLIWSQVEIKEWCKQAFLSFFLVSFTGNVVSPSSEMNEATQWIFILECFCS